MSEIIENIENSENLEKEIENVRSDNLEKDVEEDVIVENTVKLEESIFTMKELKEKIKKLKKVDRLFAKLTGKSCSDDTETEEDIPSCSNDNNKTEEDIPSCSNDNNKIEGDITSSSGYVDVIDE